MQTQALENVIGHVVTLGFTPNGGSVLIAHSNGEVITWDLTANTASSFHFAPLGNGSDTLSAAFSPDGTTIAVATSDTAQLWDPATGQRIGNPIVDGDSVIVTLAFSADGKTLAAGAYDSSVRLWNVSYLTPAGARAELCARIRPTSAWTAESTHQDGMSIQRACATVGA